MCPICTIAAGTGVVIFRKLGIDDSITGLWLGGLLISVTLWTIKWFRSKNFRFWGLNFLTGVVYFAAVLIPFYQKNIISKAILGSHYQTLWGVDKLLLGIIFGSVFLMAGAMTYELIKRRNNGRAHFPFERVALPIAPLVILSIVFYFVTG